MPAATAGEPGATPFVQVRIDQVTPQVVTTTSEPVVTVAGTVTNIGDRPVHDVMIRLEHAPAVPASTGLRTDLDGDTDQYQTAMDFATVSPVLQRGQKAKFSLSAPMRSVTSHSLGRRSPRRLPAAGQRQRHTRLRRTGPAGQRPLPVARAGRAARPVEHRPAPRVRWTPWSCPTPPNPFRSPCCGRWPTGPGWRPGVPGGTIPVRLMDDDLATSLAAGGRLDVLLSAAEFATSHGVDPDGAVGRSVCLAVDPDLLVTVNAMTAGYVVSDSPRRTRAGAGHPDASRDRAGRGDHLAEPAARAGAPDLRRAAALRASRPGRRPADRGPRPQRDRDRRPPATSSTRSWESSRSAAPP